MLATDPETEATQLEVTEYSWTVLSGEDTDTAGHLAPERTGQRHE